MRASSGSVFAIIACSVPEMSSRLISYPPVRFTVRTALAAFPWAATESMFAYDTVVRGPARAAGAKHKDNDRAIARRARRMAETPVGICWACEPSSHRDGLCKTMRRGSLYRLLPAVFFRDTARATR